MTDSKMAIPAIITALDSFFANNETVEAEILAWLKQNLPLTEEDIDVFDYWFKTKDRCNICGHELITTFKVNRDNNPPIKEYYSFCPNCYI